MQPNARSLPLLHLLVAALVLFNHVPNNILGKSNSWEQPRLHVVFMLTFVVWPMKLPRLRRLSRMPMPKAWTIEATRTVFPVLLAFLRRNLAL